MIGADVLPGGLDDPTKLWGDEIAVGDEYALGSYEMTQDGIIAFATQWDPLGMHVDPVAAEHSPFGALIASGAHSLSAYQRLCAEDVYSRWQVYVGRTYRDVKFILPVYAGSVLTGRARVISNEPRNAERSLVTTLGWLEIEGKGRSLEVTCETYVFRS